MVDMQYVVEEEVVEESISNAFIAIPLTSDKDRIMHINK